jgi:hypothetical protein
MMYPQYNHKLAMNRAFETYVKNKHRLEFNTRDGFNFFSNPFVPIRNFSRFGMDDKSVDDFNDGGVSTMSLDEISRVRSRDHPYVSKPKKTGGKRRKVVVKIEPKDEELI